MRRAKPSACIHRHRPQHPCWHEPVLRLRRLRHAEHRRFGFLPGYSLHSLPRTSLALLPSCGDLPDGRRLRRSTRTATTNPEYAVPRRRRGLGKRAVMKSNADGYLGHWLVDMMRADAARSSSSIDPAPHLAGASRADILAAACVLAPTPPWPWPWLNVIITGRPVRPRLRRKLVRYGFDKLVERVKAQCTPERAAEIAWRRPGRHPPRRPACYAAAKPGALQWGLDHRHAA